MAYPARYLTFLALACGAFTRASAAEMPPSVRFTAFAVDRIGDLSFVPQAGIAPRTLSFQPTARSRRHEYRGPMPLHFADTGTGEVVAAVDIPARMSDVFLLFLPRRANRGEEQGLRYTIAVIDDAATAHRAGELTILNLSGLELHGTVNRNAVDVRAGLNRAIAVGRSAAILLRAELGRRSVQSYANTVLLEAGERALLILYPPHAVGSFEAQSRLLVDTPPALPK